MIGSEIKYPRIEGNWTAKYNWYNSQQVISPRKYYALVLTNIYLIDNVISKYNFWHRRRTDCFIGILPGNPNSYTLAYDSIVFSYSGANDLARDNYSHNHILCSYKEFLNLIKTLNIKETHKDI